jgi:hypothetical protein
MQLQLANVWPCLDLSEIECVKLKHLYLGLCIIGTVLPYSQLIPWILEHRLRLPLLVGQIATSRVSASGWLDVLVSAVTLLVFILTDGRRNKIRGLWAAVLGTLTVGVSLGLPLFLLLREIGREKEQHPGWVGTWSNDDISR